MGEAYRINDQSGLYFITCTVIDWMDVFTRKEHKLIVVESLNYCVDQKGLVVHAWALMSNHLHLVVRAREGYELSGIVRDFKKYTSRRIRENIQTGIESRRVWLLDRMAFRARQAQRLDEFKLWEADNHAVELLSNTFIDQKVDYIHKNPVKAMIVAEPEHYLFSSAIDYAGGKGLVKVELIDP